MFFKVLSKDIKTNARVCEVTTSHGAFQTPIFMPVGTQATVKAIEQRELEEVGAEIILGNTYHLYLRPGEKEIKKFGGLHKFMNWSGSILTDSGGYQVFSLGKNFRDYSNEIRNASLVNISDEGVWFKSHIDGSKHFFTPEKVLDIQKDLGSDIIMVLDECTEYPASKERAEFSAKMTHRWARRSANYWERFRKKGKAIFGIVQGSVYKDLRENSVMQISALKFDGIAVGGVSVGEGKKHMYQVMRWVGPLLPKNKPHYLMGVGEPEDILEAVKWGFDMFDCVLPTRLGRHGTCWVTSNWKNF